jgi:hypothetical protein
MPKQTQYKAKQSQFQRQKMLPRKTINTRRDFRLEFAGVFLVTFLC